MNLSSETGTIVRWEKFEAGDTAWSAIANTSNFITPTLILVILNQLCLGTSSRQLYRVFKYQQMYILSHQMFHQFEVIQHMP
jgi:hypothetical protein